MGMARNIEEDIFGIRLKSVCNSKVKGNTNERAAAKSFGEWVGVPFVRVPMSGGLRRIDTDKIVGDIIPDTIDKSFDFPFVVETKHLQQLVVKRFLSSRSRLFSIWEQPYADAIRSGKLPLALLRSNGFAKGEYYLVLEASQGGTIMAMNCPIAFSGGNHKHSLIGFMFSDVCKHVKYEQFAKAVRRLNITSKSKMFVE